MSLKSLNDAYLEELKDLYDAEHQITQALPKMEKAAHNQELKKAFQTHLQQTEGQIQRLEQVFESLGKKATRKTCAGMKGIIAEGQEKLKEATEADPDTLDAALIAAAQHVEHYEMAGYGCVRTWAKELGFNDQARLLQQTLDEEGQTDKLLTQLAESRINLAAEGGGQQTMKKAA
jgi:ferritin-like metal-binding protein YciE